MEANDVRRAVSDPRLFFHHLNWRLHRGVLGKTGCLVMERDWDNLIILDACRYDDFVRTNTVAGTLDRVISTGSHTTEFLETNFDDTFHDTVYVTATPQVEHQGVSDRFYDVRHLWESAWDDELRTVPPASTADAARRVESEHPQKRLIVHFVQPHYPFLGETGRRLEELVEARSGLSGDTRDDRSIWDHLEGGNVPGEMVRDAYRENLEIVLPHVRDLVSDFTGKTVVTSDHGNVFGRFGLYGHPPRKYLRELVEVPWLVVEADERKSVSVGRGSKQDAHVGDQTVSERLAHLGYAE